MDISVVLNDVAKSLNDPDFVRWSEAMLIGYLNDGCLLLCKTNALVNTKTATITLQNGTLQSAGSESLQIIDIHRALPHGRSLRRIDQRLIDTVLPLWHVKPLSDDTREFIIDGMVKNRFWVYPPALGKGAVEATIVQKPDVVGLPQNGVYDPFPLADEHASTIKSYMLHRAYLIDTGAGSAQKAQMYLSGFYAAAGVTGQEESNSTNARSRARKGENNADD